MKAWQFGRAAKSEASHFFAGESWGASAFLERFLEQGAVHESAWHPGHHSCYKILIRSNPQRALSPVFNNWLDSCKGGLGATGACLRVQANARTNASNAKTISIVIPNLRQLCFPTSICVVSAAHGYDAGWRVWNYAAQSFRRKCFGGSCGPSFKREQ